MDQPQVLGAQGRAGLRQDRNTWHHPLHKQLAKTRLAPAAPPFVLLPLDRHPRNSTRQQSAKHTNKHIHAESSRVLLLCIIYTTTQPQYHRVLHYTVRNHGMLSLHAQRNGRGGACDEENNMIWCLGMGGTRIPAMAMLTAMLFSGRFIDRGASERVQGGLFPLRKWQPGQQLAQQTNKL